MESLTSRIASAMAQAEQKREDTSVLGDLLRSLELEAHERYQLLGIAMAYIHLEWHDHVIRACDKALDVPGSLSEEAIAYHYKGRSLRYIASSFHKEEALYAPTSSTCRILELARDCFQKSITDDSPDEFILGSLVNLAHVYEELEQYQQAITTVGQFVRSAIKARTPLPSGVKQSMRDLLVRCIHEIRQQQGHEGN